jgi:hypothetical protein
MRKGTVRTIAVKLEDRKTHMLTTDSDQVPHRQSAFAAALLDYAAKKLTALREPNRIELARRIESRVDDLGNSEKLFTSVGDLSLCGAEEGCTSMDEKGEKGMKVRERDEARGGRKDSLIARSIIALLNDVNEDAFEIGTSLQVGFEGDEAGCVVAVPESVPDLH